MSTNMELITSVTVGSGGAASVTLPATGTIPQTYTDLKIVMSGRNTAASGLVYFSFNGNTSNRSSRLLYGSGSGTSSVTYDNTDPRAMIMNESGYTANTFSSGEMYIPNYTGSNFKSFSADSVQETNATTAFSYAMAGLWSNTAAITTITLSTPTGSFAEGSTFYLYGISAVTSTPKATGGIVSSDGTYNYHMFPFSGTFTPTQNITADYLVIAGGGGGGAGGARGGGGGGAGGYRTSIGGSALSLTAQAYVVTVGAGSAGGVGGSAAAQGGSSIFSTITSTGGGGGGCESTPPGQNGGSGGGGAGATNVTAAGTGIAGQGNNGGIGFSFSNFSGGGGGGASAIGAAGLTGGGGNGGAGTANSISGSSVTYAGGGGGASYTGTQGSGGAGGGGGGSNTGGASINGTANTGGGGGGQGLSGAGGNGGSGLVIIRYAI